MPIVVLLNVVMSNDVLLSVVMLSVIMLNAVVLSVITKVVSALIPKHWAKLEQVQTLWLIMKFSKLRP